MKLYLATIFAVALAAAGAAAGARAQSSADAHVAAAKAAIAPKTANPQQPWHDFQRPFMQQCAKPRENPQTEETGPNVPLEKGEAAKLVPTPFEKWYTPPIKIFDNLYYIGTKTESSYALTTSQGIILLNTNFDWVTTSLLEELRMVGLDPANIKYAVITHAHSDQAWGINTLRNLVPGVHVLMSEGDWNALANDNTPARLKPMKDMVATDGQKLTLGDTTVTMYITPGSSPGTMSIIFPLKDGNQMHMGSLIGGTTTNVVRGGLRYFPDMQTELKTYAASNARFKQVEDAAGVDTIVSVHAALDDMFAKADALKSRAPGQPHPFVSKDDVDRFSTILAECAQAKLAWVTNE
jgi:metallo-beta-lactamase class B